MNKNTFTTTDGLVVEFGPISTAELQMSEDGLRQEWIEAGEQMEPPTYEVEVVGGGKEIHVHDETTLEIPGDEEQTAKNKLDWEMYQGTQRRFMAAVSAIRTDYVLEALKIDLPEDGSWMERQRKKHIKVPDGDPEALRKHYVTTLVLKTADDLLNAIESVMALSLKGIVSEEAVRATSRSFRDTLSQLPARQGGNSSGGVAQEPGGVLDAQHKADGGARREDVGDGSKPVQRARKKRPARDAGA